MRRASLNKKRIDYLSINVRAINFGKASPKNISFHMNSRPPKICSLNTYVVLWIHWCVANCRFEWKSANTISLPTDCKIVRKVSKAMTQYSLKMKEEWFFHAYPCPVNFYRYIIYKQIRLGYKDDIWHPVLKNTFSAFFPVWQEFHDKTTENQNHQARPASQHHHFLLLSPHAKTAHFAARWQR